jgi:SM-20-related protein
VTGVRNCEENERNLVSTSFRSMPAPGFFRNLGLFVRSDIFDAAARSRIQREMCAAESEKARIVGKEPEGVLDESIRKVIFSRHLEKSTKVMVRDYIKALKPSLEEHFRVPLEDMEKPAFLRYREGAFYKPHRDAHPGDPPDMSRRRISVVIFLNATSKEPAANCYGGGSLTFYGLMDGPAWEKCAFSLEAEPGLLIAFRSETLHEVQPVTFGERFTIVTWFLS